MVERRPVSRKRIMREFKINELSAVDRPAQADALAVIMKRADNEDFDKGNPNHDERGRFSSGSGGGSGGGKEDTASGESVQRAHTTSDAAKWRAHVESNGAVVRWESLTLDNSNLVQVARGREAKIVGYLENHGGKGHLYPGAIPAFDGKTYTYNTKTDTYGVKGKKVRKDDDATVPLEDAVDADIIKATKTEDGVAFPASDYAYVPDPEAPSTWKLRLTSSPGGTPDSAIVGAAAAALGPAGYRGNRVDIPADDRDRVVGRVRAAWRKANPDKDPATMPDVLKKGHEDSSRNDGLLPDGLLPVEVSQAAGALDFDTILAESEAREAAEEVREDLREKWCAIQRALSTIAADDSVSAPDKITRMQESLQQYIDSLAEQSATIAESMTKTITADSVLAGLLAPVGAIEGDLPMTDVEKRQLAELQKSVEALQKQLAAATAAEPAKKAAELADALTKAEAQIAALTEKAAAVDVEKADALAKAGMSDAEKEHMSGLDPAARMAFMRASPDERQKLMAKAAEANPVVYKSADGTEFRKSDGDKVIALAKRADESEKIAKAERDARETSDLTKRADEVLKAFAGETPAKVEILREIAKMPEGPRAALEKMLEVGAKAIDAAYTRIGHARGPLTKSGVDFEKRVADIQARDKCSKSDAMTRARVEDPAAFEAYQSSGAN